MSDAEANIAMRYVMRRQGFGLDVELDVPMHGITGIFGRSGAGKTTLLRCIAGLETPETGRLIVAGDCWQDGSVALPPHRRQIGYVFQEPRLFAHLDVRRNLEYGMKRASGDDSDVGFVQAVELLGLGHLLGRMPDSLSGGAAPRVAIGRALLCAPRFVLMDEPLAALDQARRAEILPFLERLHAELAVPIIYVSHSIDEICRLCDQLIVMHDGRALANGGLQSVLLRTDLPGIGGEEAGVVVDAVAVDVDEGFEMTRVRTSGGDFLVAGRHASDSRLRLRIKASDVSLCRNRPHDTTILNILPARVEAVDEECGSTELVRLRFGADHLVARVTRRSRSELRIEPGDEVLAQVKSVAVRQAFTVRAPSISRDVPRP